MTDTQDFHCDYCGETHSMTLREMQMHIAERLMAALTTQHDKATGDEEGER